MTPQRGRPKTDNPKDFTIRCRIDEELHNNLIEYCQQNNIPKSKVMIDGIKTVINGTNIEKYETLVDGLKELLKSIE